MGYNSVPPRWQEYSKIGKLIPGTQIIPFKVPLREEICRNLYDSNLSFTVKDLIDKCKTINMSMIIDLTQTKRFYNSEDLEQYNIKYVKLSTKGGGCMPSEFEVKQFCNIVDCHLKKNPHDVVGVHCTHGLNRTGYFICRYMIDCLGIMGSTSVDLFEESRGHKFDRDNYRDSLIAKVPTMKTNDVCGVIHPRNSDFNSNDISDYNRSSSNQRNCGHISDHRPHHYNNESRDYLDYKSYKAPRNKISHEIRTQNNEYDRPSHYRKKFRSDDNRF